MTRHLRPTFTMAAAVALALGLTSCDEPPAAPTPVQPPAVTVTQIVNVGQVPGPGTNPSPAPTNCVPEAIDSVRVNPFGYACPAGVTPPRNGSGEVPANCTAIFTATPKRPDGTDVPAALHGSNITWAVPIGSERVQLTDFGDQPFNKNVTVRPGSAPGEVQITATVCGKTGAWIGRTTAATASSSGGLAGADGFEFVIADGVR